MRIKGAKHKLKKGLGATVMLGYYKNEEATADMIHVHADGERWLHSGDVGYMDENGILYVTGRVKRIIMTKGADGNITKLFPSRIESVIASAEAVREVCVVGVADKKRISIPKAFVILAEGYQPEEAVRKDILQVCKKGLPDYMIPEEIVFRGEFPRTERGKVDYRELEKLAEG